MNRFFLFFVITSVVLMIVGPSILPALHRLVAIMIAPESLVVRVMDTYNERNMNQNDKIIWFDCMDELKRTYLYRLPFYRFLYKIEFIDPAEKDLRLKTLDRIERALLEPVLYCWVVRLS